MREIKFRGKCVDTGRWIYGFYSFDMEYNAPMIMQLETVSNYPHEPESQHQKLYQVDPKTVGQYTGLKDVNGVEIYEGDKLIIHQFLFEGIEVEREFKCNVVYMNEAACFGVKVTDQMNNFFLQHTGFDTLEEMPAFSFSSVYGLHEESFQIIGNIHEHKHLTNE